MTEGTVAQSEDAKAVPPQRRKDGLSVGLFIIFAMMLWLVVVSVAYAVAMIGFLADGGYFLSYGSLCRTVPMVAGIDRFAPFLVAAIWLGAIYFGVTRNQRFYRYVFAASLLSIIYGALDVVIGPFTFRVGPADFDPSSVVCGRWPRAVSQLPDLHVLQMDWLGLPISAFGLSLVLIGLTIFVYLRISRRVSRRFSRPMARGGA